MLWTYLPVGVAAAGLIPLAYLTARVWAAARRLARELERTRRLLEKTRPRAVDEG